ncbi:50S ribosomal protein L3 [Parvimonas parva]|uniref:50S ribosomal protein L3 n=1 Tax=Parvimonas parva TaxID=2769485 RepID=UPI0038B305D7
MKSILGKKIGMTQIFTEDGAVVPVTVVEAGPMFVIQVKTVETDGYNAIQCGYVDKKEKKVTKPLKGHFDKVSVGYKRFVREFRLNGGETFETGQEIKVDLFAEGDKVDVIGTSKGKGTQGAIKRWNYGRGPEGHGSKSHRVAGARSAGTYPGRVLKGRKASGKMGNEKSTVQNLVVVKVDVEKNLILVKGAIPGPKGGLVTIREAVKR